ncbi:SpoIIE family protein phosphatase [Crossiella sp. CA-258035]|uniref:SpoIIE family protein phosphatase n=1 Tax=Crossiella sp. CA-258035 TaxID=2981138 RepID=UPI0024BBFC4E|nr:SpoIIE family protein phosphatase [Crossiella sp. CA-258035]WHT22949.1 SpoIIE family protein phosphatase [Crossiella sp. CA-258035]
MATVDAELAVVALNSAGRVLLGLAQDVEPRALRLSELFTGPVEALVPVFDGGTEWTGRLTAVAGGTALRCFAVAAGEGRLVLIAEPDEGLARQRFLRRLELEFQATEEAEEVMAAAARLLGEHIGSDRCAYARAEADEDHFLMSGDHATGLPHLPGRFAMAAFGEGCLRAMRAGQPWVVHDSADDERLHGADLHAYQVTGIRAVICLPLHKAGRFVAAMAVHQAHPRRWTAAEVDLVGVVANRCWESVQRVHSIRALREGEERYRLLFELATDSIWLLDHDLRFIEANPAACALLGVRRDALLGRRMTDLVAAHGADALAELAADPDRRQAISDVWQLRRADGSTLSVELSVQSTPTGLQAIARDVTARLRAEAEREALLRREHEIAQALQSSLLPRELPALEWLSAAARYLPAATHAQAGGDWYEVLPVSTTAVALAVGDVVGKGTAAAVVMGQLRSALAAYLLEGHGPAAALGRLNTFARSTPGAMASTCACLLFDWQEHTLTWALAGHLPPMLVQPEGVRPLSVGGAVLGAGEQVEFQEHTAVLRPGDSVVLYTDGLVERRGEVIDESLAGLAELLRQRHALGPAALVEHLTTELLAGGQEDDVALVVVRAMPAPLVARVPAEPGQLSLLRRQIARWAVRAAVPAELLDDIQLVVGEAAANAVEHAYPKGKGEFDYQLARTADGAVLGQVVDHGAWRPKPADRGYRGRGLELIQELSDEASIESSAEGTTVRFRFAAAKPAAADQPGHTIDAPVAAASLAVAEGDPAVEVVCLRGELDLIAARPLREQLLARAGARDARDIVLDLTALAYLSSSGVALLLEGMAVATAAGRSLSIRAAQGSAPAKILALSGIPVTAWPLAAQSPD